MKRAGIFRPRLIAAGLLWFAVLLLAGPSSNAGDAVSSAPPPPVGPPGSHPQEFWVACDYKLFEPLEGFPTRYCQDKMNKALYFRSNNRSTKWWYCVARYPGARPKGGIFGAPRAANRQSQTASASAFTVVYCSGAEYFAAQGQLYRAKVPTRGGLGLFTVSVYVVQNGKDLHLGRWNFWNAKHFHIAHHH